MKTKRKIYKNKTINKCIIFDGLKLTTHRHRKYLVRVGYLAASDDSDFSQSSEVESCIGSGRVGLDKKKIELGSGRVEVTFFSWVGFGSCLVF